MTSTPTSTTARMTGVVPPVCTPLTPDRDVDIPSLHRLVDHLIDNGVDGLFVLGSTSEVAFLTDRQRAMVTDAALDRARGRVPVFAGVIDMTTPRVMEHALSAAKAGCDGVVATAPFYTRTHQAEIERHFRVIADQVGVPLYAYDLPVSVHVKLDGDLLLRLAADGVLAGLKDSSGDDAALRKLLVARDEQLGEGGTFSVLTGAELTVDSALLMGADGVVPGLGNVDPAGYTRLYRLCRAGDWAGARTEQQRLVHLMEVVDAGAPERMGRGSSALGGFKAALRLLGIIDCGLTAEPQIPLSDAEISVVRAHLERAGLL